MDGIQGQVEKELKGESESHISSLVSGQVCGLVICCYITNNHKVSGLIQYTLLPPVSMGQGFRFNWVLDQGLMRLQSRCQPSYLQAVGRTHFLVAGRLNAQLLTGCQLETLELPEVHSYAGFSNTATYFTKPTRTDLFHII